MKKRTLRLIICILAFLAVCLFLDLALYPCTYMRNDIRTVTAAYHDVIFLGTSDGKMGIDPDAVLAGRDRTGHNLCNGGEFPIDSYHLLRLLIEKQKPQTVVFEVNPVVFVTEKEQGNNYLLFYHEFPLSASKLAYAKDILLRADFRAALFPFYEYPLSTTLPRMGDTLSRKLSADYSLEPLRGTTGDYRANGFLARYPQDPQTFAAPDRFSFTQDTIVPAHIDYLYRVIDLCKEEGIELIAVTMPQADETLSAMSGDFVDAYAYFEALFADAGVPYYNFNTEYYAVAPHDAASFVDYNGHLNEEAAGSFSRILGNVLFGLP